MSKRDYYEVLGIAKDATKDDIKRAYRKIAMENHPDRNPDNKEAEERFKEATEAYEVLNDVEKRARYDRFGHSGMRGGQDFHGFSDINDIFSHFSDIFGGSSIFDDFFGGGGARGRGRRRTSGTAGSDLRITLKLTLEEIAKGVTKKIKIKKYVRCESCGGSGAKKGTSKKTCQVCSGTGEVRQVSRSVFGQFVNIQPCTNCNGEGEVVDEPCRACSGEGREQKETTVSINVPAGVSEGSYMTLRGEGNIGQRGGPAGDIIVIFQELPHDYFVREGDNIIYDLFVSFPDLALGVEVDVPTLVGKARLKIDAGTVPGKMLRMRDKGIKRLNQHGYGDELVRVNVIVPQKLSRKERELLKELQSQPNMSHSGQKDKNSFFKRFGL